jgi:protein-disulfide isomerase
MNCDAVAASRFAEVIGGFPISGVAAGWFVAIFGVSLLSRLPDWKQEAARATFWMSAFASVVSVVYLAVMLGVVGRLCAFCLGIDAVSFALLGLSFSSYRFSPKEERLSFPRWKVLLGISACSLAVAAILTKNLDTAPMSAQMIREYVDQVMTTPVLSVESGDEFTSIGPKTAPITIVEFSDFQCPYCRVAAISLKTVMQRFPGKVRLVFRNYPLDNSCNRMMQRPLHTNACEAAKAAYCAKDQGKFEAVYEQLFEHQADIGKTKVIDLAKAGGIDTGKLEQCMADPKTLLAIQKDVEEGNRLGIKGTPFLFLNGRKIDGFFPVPVWNRLITELLKGTP